MKFNIKKLSIFLILTDLLVLFKDLPAPVTATVLGIIFLSFVISHKILRSFFKVLILVSSLALLKYLFKTYLVTEAGVSLVMILAALKLWELETENDHFNMFLILALLECCLFLLSPTFIAFFIGIIKIIVFFYFILKIRNYDLALLDGKRLLLLMAPSMLLALILFYTFPRFTQGFISTTNNQMLFSGSDSQIIFNKLGPLNLSPKIVFKVYGLNSYRLPYPLLYWRETVLWDFYKDMWRSGNINFKSPQIATPSSALKYRVQLLKDYNEFLPLLDGVSSLAHSSLDYYFYNEGSFKLKTISHSSVNYEASTANNNSFNLFTPLMERKSLRLKSGQRDKIKNLILENKSSADNLSDTEKFELVKTYFKKHNYEYSLSPPSYNSLEDFILNGKSGYCSHFAAAFTYMARAIGLPARIISGYQGGEFNPFDQSLIVREMDGHTWVEVYLKNSGWYRFDPTAIVAPGRVELGANLFHDRLSPNIDLYYFQLPKRFLQFSSLNRFSLWLDALNSEFNTNIFNFDKDKQQQFLNYFIPKSFSLGWLFVITLSGSMPLFWLFFSWLNKNKKNPAEKRYHKFVTRLQREGVPKLQFESANSFRAKCLLETKNLEDYINAETDYYIKHFYERP